MSTTIVRRPRSTNAYKKLIAVGLDDAGALAVLAGKKAKKAKKGKAKKAKAVAVVVERTPEEILAESGFKFARGRVYTNGAIIEAQAVVLRSGGTKIVKTSGVGRIAAVQITRLDNGDLSLQNLAAL